MSAGTEILAPSAIKPAGKCGRMPNNYRTIPYQKP